MSDSDLPSIDTLVTNTRSQITRMTTDVPAALASLLQDDQLPIHAQTAIRRAIRNIEETNWDIAQASLRALQLQPSHSPTVLHTGPFNLGDLPAELRNQVYRHAVVSTDPIKLRGFWPHVDLPEFITLKVKDKAFREFVKECRTFYFWQNTFEARSKVVAEDFLLCLGQHELASKHAVTNIRLTRSMSTAQKEDVVQKLSFACTMPLKTFKVKMTGENGEESWMYAEKQTDGTIAWKVAK
ncbi:hypothetical protein LTR17_003342 [Elasticomyces elasticus]|nr:hypothetical protein LTR17_003342 [Elasticomyces elasticus]